MGMAHLIAKAGSTGWTAEMLDELPDDGKRYEIIDGELFVTPSPTWRHGDAVMELYEPLKAYARAHGVGHVKVAPQDVVYSRRTVVEPDLFVVPLVDGRKPRTWAEAGRLLLAVEVLSPGSQRADRWVKRALYQRENVPEYWIVDVDARLIERWRPGEDRPEILDSRLEWRPDAAKPSLVLDLEGYFAEVISEMSNY
jgi:Uma2 family endonuclease